MTGRPSSLRGNNQRLQVAHIDSVKSTHHVKEERLDNSSEQCAISVFRVVAQRAKMCEYV